MKTKICCKERHAADAIPMSMNIAKRSKVEEKFKCAESELGQKMWQICFLWTFGDDVFICHELGIFNICCGGKLFCFFIYKICILFSEQSSVSFLLRIFFMSKTVRIFF